MMNDTLAGLLEGSVKFRHNTIGDIGKARRIVNGAPEVMVKISGNAKGSGHIKAHLNYISRDGKLEMENEKGEIISGKEAVKDVYKAWKQDLGKRRANTRDTTNFVLSMPNGTDPKALKKSVRGFAKKQFGENYQYVFSLHTDVDHPHVHLTVKNLGFDGHRLHVKKGDPQKYREVFAKKLRQHGVEAEATPRATRGVIKKGMKQAIRHIRDRGLTPEVDKSKIKEIVEEFNDINAGKSIKPKPWEPIIKERQKRVRKAWLSAAKDLNESDDKQNQALAVDIVQFVNDMPPIATERHDMANKIATHFNSLQRDQPGKGQKNLTKDDQDER